MDNPTFDNWYSVHMQEQQRQEAVNRAKLRDTAIPELKKKGIKEVLVDYSGYGDSGGIDGVVYSTEAGRGSGDSPQVSEECREAVKAFVYTLLPGGFEINDGSQGSVTLDVERGRWVMRHGQNYTATEDSTRRGDI